MRATVTLQVILQQDVLRADFLALVGLLDGAVVDDTIVAGAATVAFLHGDRSALIGDDRAAVWVSPEDVDGFKAPFLVTMEPCNGLATAAAIIVDAVCSAFGARPAVIDNRLALFIGSGPSAADSAADINDYHGFDVAAATAMYTSPDPADATERLFKCSRCARWTPVWDIVYGDGEDNVFIKRLRHMATGGASVLCGECAAETDAIAALGDDAFFNDSDGAVDDWEVRGPIQSGCSVIDG